MKVQLEAIRPDEGSSFRLLLDSRMNDFYYWHHHPEWELNYIRGADGLYCTSEGGIEVISNIRPCRPCYGDFYALVHHWVCLPELIGLNCFGAFVIRLLV